MDFKFLTKNAAIWVFLLTTGIMVGASVYQWLVCVPTWENALAEFHRAGAKPRLFWRSGIEEAALISGLIALFFYWRTAVRVPLLLSVIFYCLGMGYTVLWFLPRLEIMGMFNGIIPDDPALLSKTVSDWIAADKIRFFGMVLPGFLCGMWAFKKAG